MAKITQRKLHESITSSRVCDAIEADDNIGFCVSCGDDAYGVEPDARNYECESCGDTAVYGAEDILIAFNLPDDEE